MERAEAIGRLPTTYAAIITLLDEGADDQTIAERLGIDPSSVAPLVTVAKAKLSRILSEQ